MTNENQSMLKALEGRLNVMQMEIKNMANKRNSNDAAERQVVIESPIVETLEQTPEGTTVKKTVKKTTTKKTTRHK
jgi:hypothetical protein